MLIKIINFFIKINLVFVSEFIMTSISYLYGNRCKFLYIDGLWILSDKTNGDYINFFVDPRTNLENDILKLLRDVFLYRYTPKEGDNVITVGAGLGHELLILNESMKNTGKILCLEALPVLMPGLEKTILNNNFNNCKTYNYAIGKIDNTFLEISNSPDNHLARTVYEDYKSSKAKVSVVTMDTFCKIADVKLIDFLSVNIEGAELDLITNFQHINMVKNISISCHDFLFYRDKSLDSKIFCTFEKIKDFLISNNFDISVRNTGIDYKDFYVYGINKSLKDNI
jgi:FkbM family methyltransferase